MFVGGSENLFYPGQDFFEVSDLSDVVHVWCNYYRISSLFSGKFYQKVEVVQGGVVDHKLLLSLWQILTLTSLFSFSSQDILMPNTSNKLGYDWDTSYDKAHEWSHNQYSPLMPL